MSEETMVGWTRYKGETVMVQLRTQPYIGVTGEELTPIMKEEGFGTTPCLRGTVSDVWLAGDDAMVEIQTTDPNPGLPDNKVYILLSAKRDIGYMTRVKASRIVAQPQA